MIINTLNNSRTKILLDTEDLKNHDISINDFLSSPEIHIKKILSSHTNIDTNLIQKIEIYSFKFITFKVVIDLENTQL